MLYCFGNYHHITSDMSDNDIQRASDRSDNDIQIDSDRSDNDIQR